MYKNYFAVDEISLLQKLVKHNIGQKFDSMTRVEIRQKLFEIFEMSEFRELYLSIAFKAANLAGLAPNSLVVQKMPTPRIFNPGDHGTSIHCDYWYGHGIRSFTIWIPVTEIEIGNSFYICPEEVNDATVASLEKNRGIAKNESQIINSFEPVVMESGIGVMFNSIALHASPINSTNKIRISFDFRIGDANDLTSTKDLLGYYRYENGKFILINPFEGSRYLKYICGGHSKNTLSQQLLIEAVARARRINIVAEEAEIERYGAPILQTILSGEMQSIAIDGVVIASKSILSEEVCESIKVSKIRVYSALENEFLN